MTHDPIRSPVDYVELAGARTPGIAWIEGASSPRSWDVRKGYGVSGATVVFKGVPPAAFKLMIVLTTPEDWDAWHAWRPIVARPPTPDGTATARPLRPAALDIVHPIPNDLGIRSVVVTDVKQPVESDPGKWTIEIGLLEFRAPVRALVRPTGSDNVPTPDRDPVIEGLTAQLNALARS